MVRRQKAALSTPLLSIPPSTIITITDVLELATTVTAMGSTTPPACSAASRRSRAQVQARERGTGNVTERAQDSPAPVIPGEGSVCRGKWLFPDTGAVQAQQKGQAA